MSTTGIRTFTNNNYTATGNLNATTATINNLTVTNSSSTYLTIQKRADVVNPITTPMFRKFITALNGSTGVYLADISGLVVGMVPTGSLLTITGNITAINTTTNLVSFSSITGATVGGLITFYTTTNLGVLALDYNTLTGMTMTITPYTIASVPIWYTGISFVNIPTDNSCMYEFNFIIFAPANTKTLSFSNSTISINGTSYTLNGYNNLSIGPTTITYILQTIKIISGNTSSAQTYSIFTTIQGL